MYKTEGGVKSFMSGSGARVMWLLPFTVIHLGVYESKYFSFCRLEIIIAEALVLMTLIIPAVSKRILANLKPDE